MRGISPIIAIVIILLITIAIAGAAYSYISVVWGGLVSKVVEITGHTCTNGLVTIYLKNIGTDVLSGSDITIERDGTTLVSGTDYNAISNINQGGSGKMVETGTGCGADTYCKYTVIVAGRVYTTDVMCEVVVALSPTITNGQLVPISAPPGTVFTVTADISDPNGVDTTSTKAHIQDPDEADIAVVDLYDDGTHSDGGADDGTYGNIWDSTGFCAEPLGCAYYVDITACDMLGVCGEEENI